MNPIILYRSSLMEDGELEAAEKHFTCRTQRTAIGAFDLVIARYSALPFYRELEEDLAILGAKLINTFKQHNYIADMRNWCEDLEGLTPKTWYRTEDVPPDETGPFVLKGKTNSRKHDWKTHMWAADLKAARDVEWRLYQDGLIGQGSQDIYIRKFVPLMTYCKALNGLPITKEFRTFVCNQKILSSGFYWNSFEDLISEQVPGWVMPSPAEAPVDLIQEVIRRVGDSAKFYVIDTAYTEGGDPIVIELNDGQMSGLSANDPDVLYGALRDSL